MPKHFFETSSIDTEKNWRRAKSTDPPALYSWFRERGEDRIFTPGCHWSGEVNDRTPTSPANHMVKNSSTVSTRQSEEYKPLAFLYLLPFPLPQKKN